MKQRQVLDIAASAACIAERTDKTGPLMTDYPGLRLFFILRPVVQIALDREP